MSEIKIQSKIIMHLEQNGFYVIRLRSVSPNGLPDLLAIKNGRHVFFEVKKPGLKATDLQEYRRTQLIAHGSESYIVHSIEEIESIIND